MKNLFRWLAARKKAILAEVGAAASWALAAFPSDRTVQLAAGLVAVLLTGLTVHQVSNGPDAPTADPLPPVPVATDPAK